jgi:hypothetical protein
VGSSKARATILSLVAALGVLFLAHVRMIKFRARQLGATFSITHSCCRHPAETRAEKSGIKRFCSRRLNTGRDNETRVPNYRFCCGQLVHQQSLDIIRHNVRIIVPGAGRYGYDVRKRFTWCPGDFSYESLLHGKLPGYNIWISQSSGGTEKDLQGATKVRYTVIRL